MKPRGVDARSVSPGLEKSSRLKDETKEVCVRGWRNPLGCNVYHRFGENLLVIVFALPE